MADPLDLLAGPAIEAAHGLDLLADPSAPGPFKRGLRTGVADLKAMGGGLAQMAGRGFGMRPLEEWGAQVVQNQAEQSAPDRMQVEDVGAAFERGVLPGIGAAADLVKYAVGNQLPIMATMALSGGVGGAAGRALAAKGASEAVKRAALTRGAELGIGAGAVGMETGAIFPEAVETGVENPIARSLAGGVAAGALDTILPVLLARRIGLIGATERVLAPRKAGFGAVAKEAGATAAGLGAVETGTEALQTVIERMAAGQSLTGSEAMSDYLNSAVLGGIMGTLTGGAAGGIRAAQRPLIGQPQAEAPPEAAPQVEPTPAVPAFDPYVASTTAAEMDAQRAAIIQPATEPAGIVTTPQVPAEVGGDQQVQAPPAREPWAMTKNEFLDGLVQTSDAQPELSIPGVVQKNGKWQSINGKKKFSSKRDAIAYGLETQGNGFLKHDSIVKRAVERGDPVPAEVLAEYPDLASPAAVVQPTRTYDFNFQHPASGAVVTRLKGAKDYQVSLNGETLLTTTKRGEALKFAKSPEKVVGDPALGDTPNTGEVFTFGDLTRGARDAAARTERITQAIQPDLQALAGVKSKAPGGQEKIAAKFASRVAPIVDTALGLGTTEAKKAHILANVPAAVAGRGGLTTRADAEVFAQNLADKVDAGTLYSKAAATPPQGFVDRRANVPEQVEEFLRGHGERRAKQFNAEMMDREMAERARAEPPKFRVAMQLPNGSVVSPRVDERIHTQIFSRLTDEMPEMREDAFADKVDFGFIDSSGKYYTRDEATAALGRDAQGETLGQDGDTQNSIAAQQSVAAQVQVQATIARQLTDRLKSLIGDRANLTVKTFTAGPGAPVGGYTRVGPLKSIINFAINAKHPLSLADHEGMHFIEDNLLDARERAVLRTGIKPGTPVYERLMDRVRQYDIENRTRLADEVSSIPAEARAYGFQFWRTGELQAEGALQRVFEKIRDFLEKVANLVRGLGFQSVESVFTALDRGQFAERQEQWNEGVGGVELNSRAEIANFKEWFGDSKVVDANGRPLRVYHGTLADVTEFDLSKRGTRTGATSARQGFFFAEDAGVASSYAIAVNDYEDVPWLKLMNKLTGGLYEKSNEALLSLFGRSVKESGNPNVMSVYLSIKNPLVIDFSGGDYRNISYGEIVARAKVNGNDGVILRNTRDPGFEDSASAKAVTSVYVAFRPEQIKSAIGNRGTYDPNDPDITHSLAGVQSWYYSALSDAIGKAMADRIRSDPNKTGVIEGDNLTIDSTGMSGYYDKIVPSVVNEVLRKLGGGKVGTVEINQDHDASSNERKEWDTATVRGILQRGGEVYVGNSRGAGETNISSLVELAEIERDDPPQWYVLGDKQGNQTQPGFTITPELATRAMGGLPLFSKASIDENLSQLTQAERTWYSKAEALTIPEILAKAGKGGQERIQANEMGARLVDHADVAEVPFKTTFGAAKSEIGGSMTRWMMKNVLRPSFIAAFSNGYKNVINTFRTYTRYRDLLVNVMLKQQIPQWYKATEEQKTTTFDALLKRTLNGYTRNSIELRDLRASLVRGNDTSRRDMFDSANKMIEGFLEAEFASEALTNKVHLITPGAYQEWYTNRRAQVNSLIDKGYVPLRRYGDYTVDVYTTDAKGKRMSVVYQMFQNERDAIIATSIYQKAVTDQKLGLTVERGVKHKSARDTDISIHQFLDTARRNGVEMSPEVRERIVQALTTADSMLRNKMMERSGTPGYSHDGLRVLSEFGMNTAGKLAYAKFGAAIDSAAAGHVVQADINQSIANGVQSVTPTITVDETRNLWKEQGAMSGMYQNLADELSNMVLVPDHTGAWSQKLKTAGVMYFLGGSISGAAVNTMSIPMLLVPSLSGHTNYFNALSTSMSAWKTTWQHQAVLRDVIRLKDKVNNPLPGIDEVPGLRDALIEASDVLMDTELHQIMSISQGAMFSQSHKVQKAMEIWMAPFRIAEQTNRITSFIAAYKLASDPSFKKADGTVGRLQGQELFNFAHEMVDATQNNYAEWNRPGASAHPVWSLLMMFKSFPLFMTETIVLMYKANPKVAVNMLLGLVLMTGIQGLPFAETIEDMIDTIAQRLFNSPFNTRRAMRNFIKGASEAVVGYDASELVLRGVLNDVFGMSMSSRIGAGDFIPGTRAATADGDTGRLLKDVLGAPVNMLMDAGANVGKLVGGALTLNSDQVLEALRGGGPTAIRNFIKGTEQFNHGYASDSKGRKITDVSGVESVFQMLGVAPSKVTKEQEIDMTKKQVSAFYVQVRADLGNHMVRAMREGDTAKVAELWATASAWDEANPDMPLRLRGDALRRQFILGGEDLNRRTMMMLPRSLRSALAD